jgi:hypothetical protein
VQPIFATKHYFSPLTNLLTIATINTNTNNNNNTKQRTNHHHDRKMEQRRLSCSVYSLYFLAWVLLCINYGKASSYEEERTAEQQQHEEVVSSSSEGSAAVCQSRTTTKVPRGLSPEQIPGPVLFDGFTSTKLIQLPRGGDTSMFLEGNVTQNNNYHLNVSLTTSSSSSSSAAAAAVRILKQAIPKKMATDLVGLLESLDDQLDQDPDSVDGLPTYELFVFPTNNKYNDDNIDDPKRRQQIRKEVQELTEGTVEEILTPFVRHHYPETCQKSRDRLCTPCHSLLQRYRKGERQSHQSHYDAHVLVTIMVSLSGYDVDYRGGLYVLVNDDYRHFLPLQKGDAAIHQSNLLHGVQVYDAVVNDEQPKQQQNHRHQEERW